LFRSLLLSSSSIATEALSIYLNSSPKAANASARPGEDRSLSSVAGERRVGSCSRNGVVSSSPSRFLLVVFFGLEHGDKLVVGVLKLKDVIVFFGDAYGDNVAGFMKSIDTEVELDELL
jgi:hypothetical protein